MSRQPADSQLQGASKGTCSTVTPEMVDGALSLTLRVAMLPMRRASLCGNSQPDGPGPILP